MKKKTQASAGGAASSRVSPLSSKNPVEYKGTRGGLYFDAKNLKKISKKGMSEFCSFLVTPSKSQIAKRPKVPLCAWNDAELSDFKVGKTYPIRVEGKRSYLMTVLGLNVIWDELDDAHVVLRGKVADKVELLLVYDSNYGNYGDFAGNIEIGTVPDDPAYWTVAKPETAGSEPINLNGCKFFHVKDTGFEPAQNYFERVFAATKDPDDMRAQIVRVAGRCNNIMTDTRNLAVNSECKPFVGDPWTFKEMGIWRGVYSFQGVKVAIFQAGANYLAIPTCGDGKTIHALVKHSTPVLLAQIKTKRDAIKELENEVDQLLSQIV